MRSKINLKLSKLLISLISILISLSSMAKIEDIFKDKTEIEDPMELRDPFASPKFKSKRKSTIKSRVGRGVYDNIPKIGSVNLEELIITGVIIGPNRRAFARVGGENNSEGTTYVLKEGMKLGENRAILKAIVPGGVIFVEKSTNIYGEDEYLETVIPISE